MARILVADDDATILEMLSDLLTDKGYEVTTRSDGRATLAELKREPPDLLLLDVLIPKMNGFALIEQIRAEPSLRSLPVIMMSGIYRSRNHRTDLMARYNVLEYLDKPIAPDRLLRFIQQALRKGRRQAPEVIADNSQESTVTQHGGVRDPSPRPTPQPTRSTKGRPRPANAGNARAPSSSPPSRRRTVPSRPGAGRTPRPVVREEKREVEADARDVFGTSAILWQGAIRNNPVPTALGRLWTQRATGALLLRRSRTKKIVYVRDGDPTQVKSNLVSECLGEILVREHLITRQECSTATERMRQSGRKQGEILVEMGCLTENNLTFALELQLETKLFEPFSWQQGEFRFNSSIEPPESTLNDQWSGPKLILEGIRRHFDETRLRTLMKPILRLPLDFRSRRISWPELGLSEQHHTALLQMQVGSTIEEMIGDLVLPPVDTLRIVYALVVLGLIGPAG